MHKQIGFKRLFLSRSQKFFLDVSRLGSGFQPNKQEQFVQFLEGLNLERGVRFLYWHLVPKRKYAKYGTSCEIKEYLPWFSPEPRYHGYIQRLPNGKLISSSRFEGQQEEMLTYTYSWKKAHELALAMRSKVQHDINQRKLDHLLLAKKLEVKE